MAVGSAPTRRSVHWVVWVVTFPIVIFVAAYLLIGAALYQIARLLEITSNALADLADVGIACRTRARFAYLDKRNPYYGYFWPVVWSVVMAGYAFTLPWNAVLAALRLGWEVSRGTVETIGSMACAIWEAIAGRMGY